MGSSVTEQSNETPWYWLRPDREQVRGSLGELRALLASRALPRSTLVWMDPWAEWLPATRVPELVGVLPPSARRPKESRGSGTAQASPSQGEAPVESASQPSSPALVASEASTLSSVSPAPAPTEPKSESNIAVPTPGLPSVRKPPRPDVRPPPPPAHDARQSQSSISSLFLTPEEAAAQRAAELALTAAAQPSSAPITASVSAPVSEPELDVPLPSSPPVVVSAPRENTSAAPVPPIAPPPPSVATAPEPDVSAPRALEVSPAVGTASPTSTLDAAENAPSQALPTPKSRRSSTVSDAPVELFVAPVVASTAKPKRTALVALSAACALLFGGLVLSLRALSNRPAPTQKDVTAAVAPKPAPPAGCRLIAPAAKLAPSIERTVALSVNAVGRDYAAIGFAATRTRAEGLMVDLRTLDASTAFDQDGSQPVLSTTPDGAATGSATFQVTRDDGALSQAQPLEGAPEARLGFSGGRLVRRSNGEEAVLAQVGTTQATEPRSVRASADLYATTFRQGGLAGTLQFAWFRPVGGEASAELQRVATGVQLLGTPSLAAAADGALIAFAGRNAESEPWRLRLAPVASAGRAEDAFDFPLAEQDLGNGAIAPAVAALPERRWGLQWTQGATGRYRVQVQALGVDLKTRGPAIPVSPVGANAGQGSLWSVGERVLSLFVLPVPGKDELWGAVLECL